MELPNRTDNTQQIFCTVCQLEVVDREQIRLHYRSDLHLVNLKRKLAGLGPLTEAEFARRLELLQQSKQGNEANGDSDGAEDGEDASKKQGGKAGKAKRRRERKAFVCEICHKTFSSEKAYLNHEKSKRHLDIAKRHAETQKQGDMSELSTEGEGEGWAWAEDDNRDEMMVDDELQRRLHGWDEHDSDKRCVFDENCSTCANADEALEHMFKCSGFFVPHREFLSDADGLVRYLAQKVCIGYACVACDKGFADVEDVRRHMKDVGHCRMTSNEDIFLEEYGEFYTWTTPADGKIEEEEDGEQWEQVEGGDEDAENAEKESNVVVFNDQDDTMSLIDNTPIGRLQTHAHDDEQADADAENIYELSIGNKSIGHRSLKRYYKQASGPAGDQRDSVVAVRSAAEMRVAAWRAQQKGMSLSQANGQSFALRRRQCFELSVGSANYYVRKSKLRMNLTVLNSGYRA